MNEAMSDERLAEIRAYNDEYGVGGTTDADSIITELLDEVDRLNAVLDANRVVRNAAESSSRTYKAVTDMLKAERTRLRAELDRCAGLNISLVNENADLTTRAEKAAAKPAELHDEYGVRATYVDTTESEGPIGPDRDEAAALIAELAARPGVLSAIPLQRLAGDWREVKL